MSYHIYNNFPGKNTYFRFLESPFLNKSREQSLISSADLQTSVIYMGETFGLSGV